MESVDQGVLHPLVVALITRSLQRLAPGLVPGDFDFETLLSRDSVPRSRKLELLNAAYERGGGRLVLRIGGVLHDPGLPPQPILFMLKNTSSVENLFFKCRELWPSLNTRNRVELRELGTLHARAEYVSIGGGRPTVVESLHICGLAIAMLEFLGCRGLEVRLLHDKGRASLVYSDRRYFEPEPGVVNCWSFRWRAFVPRDRLEGLDDYLRATARFDPLEDKLTPRHRLAQLVRENPTHPWSLALASRELGFSSRSLQRTLADAETTFTDVVWNTRVELAEELLVQDETVADIAVQLGFSNSSHLGRRFSRVVGMSPAEFRKRRRH